MARMFRVQNFNKERNEKEKDPQVMTRIYNAHDLSKLQNK